MTSRRFCLVCFSLVILVLSAAAQVQNGQFAGTITDPSGAAITGAKDAFDAILLDVDNGPDGLSRKSNDRLYTRRGLEATRKALRPKGLLAIWSAAPSDAFTADLQRAGFVVEIVKARANKGRGMRHIIWAATRPG